MNYCGGNFIVCRAVATKQNSKNRKLLSIRRKLQTARSLLC